MRACLWMLAALALVLAGGSRHASPQPAQDGWIMLFNGRNMDGWTRMNGGDWAVEDGMLKYKGGGNGWLRTAEQFADFQVIAEWRYPVAEGNHDSGLFIRASDQGNPWPAPAYQLNMGPGDNMASLSPMGNAPRVRGDRAVPALIKKPGGEWNTYDLIVVGSSATCIVNGQKAWDATGLGLGAGYLGWQGEGPHLEVRSMRVRRLTPTRGG
jgi:hypothetical protein